jgi:RNA polymerase sigma-70 factor (sigma-E family)
VTVKTAGGFVDRGQDFSEFVVARWPRLVRSAVLLGCSIPEAEDVVQTALLRCYTSWGNVAKASDRDAYVYRVLVNCHHDSRRRRWWREKPTDELPEQAQDARSDLVDVTDMVSRSLAALSRTHREVVVLRYYADLGEQQIAEALRIPPGTVKSRLSRALVRLSNDADLADLHGGSQR